MTHTYKPFRTVVQMSQQMQKRIRFGEAMAMLMRVIVSMMLMMFICIRLMLMTMFEMMVSDNIMAEHNACCHKHANLIEQ